MLTFAMTACSPRHKRYALVRRAGAGPVPVRNPNGKEIVRSHCLRTATGAAPCKAVERRHLFESLRS